MEGACGKILLTDDLNYVIKKVHRRNRPQQRTCSLRAPEQAKMQERARGICELLKLQMLFVPRAWAIDAHNYKMEKIVVDKPLVDEDIKGHAVLEELKTFYGKAKDLGVFPMDYELYVQPDGRVAMIDFDKFGSWLEDGGIQFPWGMVLSSQQVQQLLIVSLP